MKMEEEKVLTEKEDLEEERLQEQVRKDLVDRMEDKLFAYMMSNPKYMASALQVLTAEDLRKNQDMFRLLERYFNKYKGCINYETLQILQQKGSISHDLFVRTTMMLTNVDEVNEYVKDFADFSFICEQIQLEKSRRIIWNVAEQIVNEVPKKKTDEDFLSTIGGIVNLANTATVNRAQQKKIVNLYDSIKDIMVEMTSEAQTKDAVVPSGFSMIDKQSGGFRKGELVYIVGRKADGKSVTLINMSHNAVVSGKNVIYFSLEMSAIMCQRRYLSRATQIPMLRFKNGEVKPAEMKEFAELASQKKQKSFDGVDWEVKDDIGAFCVVEMTQSITVAQVEAIVEQKEQEMGIIFDMICVDYAGIMSSSADILEKRHQQGTIALELKRLALKRNCVCLSAAQMNREGAKKKDELSTANIAESDQIGDHLDWGIAVYTDNMEEDVAWMQTIKVRDGQPFKTRLTKKYETMSLFERDDLMEAFNNVGQ
jgi:replicative DNA helicase